MFDLIDSDVVLPTLHLGAPSDLWGYSIFPVWTDHAPAKHPLPTLIPVEVALCEIDAGPSVSELVVDHAGPEPFLLLEGTVVAGGWQDRVVITDHILVPGSVHPVEVCCVEESRWGSGDRQFHDARRAPIGVLSTLRGLGRTRPPEATTPRAGGRGDQGDVWSSVAGYQDVYGHSVTGSLNHALDRADEALAVPPTLVPLPGQQGVIVSANGHPLLAEVFDHPTQLRQQLGRIVASLGADRHRVRPVASPGWRVRSFAGAISKHALAAVGDAGTGIRAEGRDSLIDACATIDADGRLQHLSVLNVRHALLTT